MTAPKILASACHTELLHSGIFRSFQLLCKKCNGHSIRSNTVSQAREC